VCPGHTPPRHSIGFDPVDGAAKSWLIPKKRNIAKSKPQNSVAIVIISPPMGIISIQKYANSLK